VTLLASANSETIKKILEQLGPFFAFSRVCQQNSCRSGPAAFRADNDFRQAASRGVSQPLSGGAGLWIVVPARSSTLSPLISRIHPISD
jgi:hypothetical protein